jgi:hypothetical protein
MIRVTELLRRYGVAPEFPNVPAVRAAANRGTVVHELSLRIEDLHRDGDISSVRRFIEGLDPLVRPYVQGVHEFVSTFNPVWVMREQRLVDDEILLCGTPDRYGSIQRQVVHENLRHTKHATYKRNVVIDFKTSSPKSWHRYQVALYSILIERSFPDIKVDERWCVYLHKRGSFQVEIHKSNMDIVKAWNIINRYSSLSIRGDDDASS